MGSIILIEGTDGTGKTTLARKICEVTEAEYIHSPTGTSPFTKMLYEIIKTNLHDDPLSKELLMLASHVEIINMANRCKAGGDNLVMDRSLLSSLVYGGYSFEKFKDILRSCGIPSLNYDYCVVLLADKHTVLKRMTGRGIDTLDQYFIDRIDVIVSRYHALSYFFYPDACFIDTSILTPDEIFEEVNRLIL